MLVRMKISPTLGYIILTIVWSCAVLGSITKIFFFSEIPTYVSNLFYLAMGWVALLAARPFTLTAPRKIVIWILLGGLAYSGGVLFLVFDSLRFNHSVWHLFVMVGTASHYVAVILCMFTEYLYPHLCNPNHNYTYNHNQDHNYNQNNSRDDFNKGHVKLNPHLVLSTKKALDFFFSLKRPTKETPMTERRPPPFMSKLKI
eukprot:TRINITY_DN5381_c0_g1_i2.p1 TRINITY_DN5381_c0_g1~~TRINITY_DN5381_c0_g1_i2.p1  ORF type:complete len:201 (-),score=35.64 TRINITY_DN5381_c0_g1_i2:169-771(-)